MPAFNVNFIMLPCKNGVLTYDDCFKDIIKLDVRLTNPQPRNVLSDEKKYRN